MTRSSILDFLEDLTLINCAIKLAENLIAFVVSIARVIIIVIAKFVWISIFRRFEVNAALLLDSDMRSRCFEVGAPWAVSWQLR